MEDKKLLLIASRDVIISVIASTLLYLLGFGELIFVFPLLLISTRHGKASSMASIAIEAAVIVLYSFLTRIDGDLSIPIALIDSYIPLSLLAAGAIWLATEGKSTEKRIVLSLLPSVFFYVALYVYLGQDTALLSSLIGFYMDVFGAIVSSVIDVSALDAELWQVVCRVFIALIASCIIPMVLCFVCATCFTYESVVHSRESDWEERVSRFELDGRLIWAFLALWLLVFLSRFISFPTIAVIALFNVTLSLSLIYMIQGFSVLYYRLRKRGRKLKSFTLFIILFAIAMFVPGINIIIVLALLLLGVIQTFFELRKTGERNEDYS